MCKNENMNSREKLSSVTEILISGDFMAMIDICNPYRAVNIHPDSRSHQGLSWDFGEGRVFCATIGCAWGLAEAHTYFQ
jgi:hypothetical protein